jgi:hypothetical protein
MTFFLATQLNLYQVEISIVLRTLYSNYVSFSLLLHGKGTILFSVKKITQTTKCQKCIILESNRKLANRLLNITSNTTGEIKLNHFRPFLV